MERNLKPSSCFGSFAELSIIIQRERPSMLRKKFLQDCLQYSERENITFLISEEKII